MPLCAGSRAAGAGLIVCIDADRIHLSAGRIDNRTRRALLCACESPHALFRGGRLRTDLLHRACPFLGGQRCLRWGLLCTTLLLDSARYGVEVARNPQARRHRLRVRAVAGSGATHITQPGKHGSVRGYLCYLRISAEILLYLAATAWSLRAAEGCVPPGLHESAADTRIQPSLLK
jgi:hypothetical protein